MKNYLETAQNYLDKKETVPDELVNRLSLREKLLLSKMTEFQDNLKTGMNYHISDQPLSLSKRSGQPGGNRTRTFYKFLLAAAAVGAVIAYFPISQSVAAEILIRQDTKRFVEQLFIEESQTEVLVDLDITQGWFDGGITGEF